MLATLQSCWALLLGMGLLMLGNGLQGTLLGVRATLEGFPAGVTGVLMSGYFAGFLVGSTLTPKLLGRVGHVRTFAALASLASTAILVHSVFVDPWTWTLMRVVSGFCYAGLYVVAESWLNESSSNAQRGQLLSIYMVVSMGGVACGQFLLNAADPSGPELFILVSVFVSLGLIPMLLSASRTPVLDTPKRVSIRELYAISPLGTVCMALSMMAQGAFFGIGPVYASQAGLSVSGIALFMSALMIGGTLMKWPIGRLSDALDRRQVIIGTSLVASVAALLLDLTLADMRPFHLLAAALLGGCIYPLYSLAIAHTNDFLEPEQIVEASGTLILIAGIGAIFGPLSAGFLMDSVGPGGLPYLSAAVTACIGVFGVWRMTQRAAKPRDEQGAYVALPLRPTVTASTWYVEAVSESGEGEEGDEQSPAAEGDETSAGRPAAEPAQPSPAA